MAFGLGFVLGPALGGFLGAIDLHLPFWVAAGLSLANGCYGTFVLPESLPRDRRSNFEWRKANPVGSLKLLRSHPELFGMAMVIFLCTLAHEVLPSVTVLYTAYRYQWTERDVGMMLAGVGVCVALVQGGLVQIVIRRFGEWPALTSGLIFGAIGFAIYGLAPTGTIFWLGVPIVSLWGLSGAATNGLMTRHVKPNEQGQLQGANNSLRGIAGLFGPRDSHHDLRQLHRRTRRLASARRAIPAVVGASARGARCCLAGGAFPAESIPYRAQPEPDDSIDQLRISQVRLERRLREVFICLRIGFGFASIKYTSFFGVRRRSSRA